MPILLNKTMAAPFDRWTDEYKAAESRYKEISNMMSERSSVPPGPVAQRHASAIRRNIHILTNSLDSLQSLSSLPSLKEREKKSRQDMVSSLRSKVDQMKNTLNMSTFGNRDSLLGPEVKPPDAMSRINGLDNQGAVVLQRQIIREQDDDLEKLEVTVISSKHIALAVNEELDLHKRLIDDLDEHVEVTDSKLQRVQRRLAMMNKRTKGGCSCMSLLSSVVGIVILIVVIYMMIKYL